MHLPDTSMFLSLYVLLFLAPLGFVVGRLYVIGQQARRTADALERIAKCLETKPLKLDDVVDLEQRL